MHFTSVLLLAPLLLSVEASKHNEHRRHHVKRKLCARNSTEPSTSASLAATSANVQVAGFAVKKNTNTAVAADTYTQATTSASAAYYAPKASSTTAATQAANTYVAAKPKTTTTTTTATQKTSTYVYPQADTSTYEYSAETTYSTDTYEAASATVQTVYPTSTAARSSNSSNFGLGSIPTLPSGIHFGWVPSDGSSGAAETIQDIHGSIGQTVSTQGYYAQATEGVLFTTNYQLIGRKASIVAAGGIFQPAVMPISWWGLTSADNRQAVAICTVMKEFTDAGVETWLRFGHEANWYQTDGTYSGTVTDFLEGWRTVATACKSIAPDVRMFWTPNIASAASYAAYWPGANYVDIVGVDYYPTAYAEGIFVSNLQAFHDTYTSENIIMAQGETALSVNTGIAAQLQWAVQITSQAVATAMPNYKAVSWFNYNKEQNFKIANCNGDSATKNFLVTQTLTKQSSSSVVTSASSS